MAHLEVTPKKRGSAWLWILLALIALAIIYFLFMRSDTTKTETVVTDTTTATPAQPASNDVLAATEPDWSKVDFNTSSATDSDIADKDIQVSGNDEYRIYSLGENILFAKGKNAIENNAEAKLKQIAASLNRNYKGAYVGVYGNTDATGKAADNNRIAAERATAVKDWLVNNGGVESAKISVHSLGETTPVASNATASGREQNRNVKIVAFRVKQ